MVKTLGPFQDSLATLKSNAPTTESSKITKDSIRDGDKINKLINSNNLSDFRKDSPQKRLLGTFYPQDHTTPKPNQPTATTAGQYGHPSVQSDRSAVAPLIKTQGTNHGTTKRDVSSEIKQGQYSIGQASLNRSPMLNPQWGGVSGKDIRNKGPLQSSSNEDHDSSFSYKPSGKPVEPLSKITINSRKNSEHNESHSGYLNGGKPKEEKKEPQEKCLPATQFNLPSKTITEDTNRRTGPIQRDHSRPPQDIKPITITSQDRSRSQNIIRKEASKENNPLIGFSKDSSQLSPSLPNHNHPKVGSFARLPEPPTSSNNQDRYSVTAAGNKDLQNPLLSRGNMAPATFGETKGAAPITLYSNTVRTEESIYKPTALYATKKPAQEGQESPKLNKALAVQSPHLNRILETKSSVGGKTADSVHSHGPAPSLNQDLRKSHEFQPPRNPFGESQGSANSEKGYIQVSTQPHQRQEFGPTPIKITSSAGSNPSSTFSNNLTSPGVPGRDSYYGRMEKNQPSTGGLSQNYQAISAVKTIQSPAPSYSNNLTFTPPQPQPLAHESQAAKVVIASKISQNTVGQQAFPSPGGLGSTLKPAGFVASPQFNSPAPTSGSLLQGPRPQTATVIYSKRS